MTHIKQTYKRKLVMEIKKIPDTSGVVKKTASNTKISEIEGKIPSISGLATNAAFIVVENKILNISNLVKKTDYDTQKHQTSKINTLLQIITINVLKMLLLIT